MFLNEWSFVLYSKPLDVILYTILISIHGLLYTAQNGLCVFHYTTYYVINAIIFITYISKYVIFIINIKRCRCFSHYTTDNAVHAILIYMYHS